MHDVMIVDQGAPLSSPEIVVLESDLPSLDELFTFMRDAELRFETLRMRLVERTWGVAGEHAETIELWLRHPGMAKIVTRHGDELGRDFRIWASDGEMTRTFDATADLATERPVRPRVVGATDPGLPAFARIYPPRTALPMESIVDTFVHPHGFARRVLQSGETHIVGSALLGPGRESIVLRCHHPRISHVLTDRPDHWLEVGVDRMTGLLLLQVEHVGDRVTHHTEVIDLELDGAIPDEAFRLHLSSDVRRLY
jgi:hypothetical protein